MSKSNYPNSQVDNLAAEFVVDTIGTIQELAAGKKITRDPAMDLEFESRVQQIIEFCKSRGMRIGIETLCAGLGTTRQELHNWEHGIGNVSQRRQDGVKQIKQLIYAFLEQAGMSGRLNPTTYIWLTKNWQGYRDLVEMVEPQRQDNVPMSKEEIQAVRADIAARHPGGKLERPEMPDDLRTMLDELPD